MGQQLPFGVRHLASLSLIPSNPDFLIPSPPPSLSLEPMILHKELLCKAAVANRSSPHPPWSHRAIHISLTLSLPQPCWKGQSVGHITASSFPGAPYSLLPFHKVAGSLCIKLTYLLNPMVSSQAPFFSILRHLTLFWLCLCLCAQVCSSVGWGRLL